MIDQMMKFDKSFVAQKGYEKYSADRYLIIDSETDE